MRKPNQLACNMDRNFVEQFMIEFHWQKSFGLMSDDDGYGNGNGKSGRRNNGDGSRKEGKKDTQAVEQ